jgi:ABC-type bacteriocin/lantibiotic exporter with double-glycine peptidase domain
MKKYSISQKHNLGCGAACLAFLLNISYDKVVNYFGEKKLNNEGLYLKEMIKFLKKYGYEGDYKYLKPKLKRKIYKSGTIVFIKRDKNYPYGHYFVRDNKKWFDSWINFLEEKNIKNAKAGFRKRLPGKPIYALFIKRK